MEVVRGPGGGEAEQVRPVSILGSPRGTAMGTNCPWIGAEFQVKINLFKYYYTRSMSL